MRIARYLIPLIILIALLASLTWLAFKPKEISIHSSPSREISQDSDDPWDPGDERDPNPKPHGGKSVSTKAKNASMLSQRKGDDRPWHPGDESELPGGGTLNA
jgi:hypothetical protein